MLVDKHKPVFVEPVEFRSIICGYVVYVARSPTVAVEPETTLSIGKGPRREFGAL